MGARNVTFAQATRWGLQRYFKFSGRAQRAEYWWFVLFTVLGQFVLSIADLILFSVSLGSDDFSPLADIFSLLVLIPTLALGWRRMHDINRSGLWYLMPYAVIVFVVIAAITLGITETIGAVTVGGLALLAVGSFIYLLVLLCSDSDQGTNRFGPSPKYGHDIDVFD